jgi:hypothetical protein
MGPYTFCDQNGSIISLVSYASAWLELKLQGQLYATISATILSPATSGQVEVSSYTFTQLGIWMAQFYVQDGIGNKTYGEPVQFTVVANVDDATLNQILVY